MDLYSSYLLVATPHQASYPTLEAGEGGQLPQHHLQTATLYLSYSRNHLLKADATISVNNPSVGGCTGLS